MIPFNKSTPTGNEIEYVTDAINSGHMSGNGPYSKKCVNFFQEKYGFKKCLLTTSCTDALEMSAVLLDLKPGDEVIVPAFTFVSTANAFKLHGANIVFADSKEDNPNIDPQDIRKKITPKTKAVCIVHYAGVACDMDEILEICKEFNLILVEDAAQAVHSFYKGRPLGSFGDFATFSFHETKNISCGEGGMLVVNNPRYFERSEIIWEKGTNRAAFKRGDVQKYECVDIGASYLLSDINAAYLWAQLENIEKIISRRVEIVEKYHKELKEYKAFYSKGGANGNGHIFYLMSKDRDLLLKYLNEHDISASFHYLSLEDSHFYKQEISCVHAKQFENELLRLPLYYCLTNEELDFVIKKLKEVVHNE